MPDLSNKVCIVTGASQGIGRGIALQLVECGATCYATGRTIEKLTELNQECKSREAKGKLIPVQCDHSNDDDVQQLFAKVAADQNSRLDLLVNNAYQGAGILIENQTTSFWDIDPFEMWDAVNNTGLRNCYTCATLGARMMVPKRKGLIINIGSFGGLTYMVQPTYGIGKCANDRMAKDCAVELKDKNVAFVSLWPSAVKTERMLEYSQRLENENHKDAAKTKWLVDHGESPEYVGKCVSYLFAEKDIMKQSGKVILTCDVAAKYNIFDIDGSTPASPKSFRMMLAGSGLIWLSEYIPTWVKLPTWMFKWLLGLAAVPQEKVKSKYE